jgi:hypothetical protein
VFVVVALVALTLSYVRCATREATAIVETFTFEPSVIPDPTLVLFVYTFTVQAIVCFAVTSIVQRCTALAHRSARRPTLLTKVMPVSVQTLAW